MAPVAAPVPQWLAPFSQEARDAVTGFLDLPGRRVACLDADGTLWAEDVGEAFLRWLAEGRMLPPVDKSRGSDEVWAEYEARVHADRAAGYAWAVLNMAGLAEADVVRLCRQHAAAWPNYRPEMRALIRGMREAGAEVWIVSASNRWVVEAVAPRIGVDPACTIAMATEVEDGRLTDRLVPPPICGAGKVEAILDRIGCAPGLAAGDGMGDFEMMQTAAFRFAVGRHDRSTELVRKSREIGWPVHLF
jgi:HAD superfamily phosphoserine phosphatase-like hydrolase